MVIRRGDIFYADLRPVVGSEQGGVRPVLIIQNDTGNKHSPTVICAAITSKMNKACLMVHGLFWFGVVTGNGSEIHGSFKNDCHCNTLRCMTSMFASSCKPYT